MSATVKITLDDRELSVPAGILITDAARLNDVHIPIFCSHAKLPPLGACRICVVEVGMPKRGPDRQPVMGPDGAPVIAWMPKPQTACTTPVQDGMHIRTTSPEAVKARKGVMEFLLVNHPLDCPVCDEGGECQLQDLAFAFGADFSRMADAKRTFVSENLGPIVKKEANRCIVCMRCVRYCDEIMGDDALTAHQRGYLTEISSFNRQPLECEQCGNCIEVCPVGALTALPYRFKARPWDLRQHITVCPYCSNGCSVRLGVRGMEILRARGTEYRGVNQEYLCARGRFGYDYVNRTDRLSAPLLRVGGELSPAGFDEAVTYAAARLREIAAAHGPGSIAFLGGEKLNLEEQYLFQKLARAVLGTPNIDARTRFTSRVPGAAILAATGGGRPSITLDQLGKASEVLILGEDLRGEAPYTQAVIIRGQHQAGLHVTVAHPRRVKLAGEKFRGHWLAVRPGAELALIHSLTAAALESGVPAGLPADVASSLEKLRGALSGWTPEQAEKANGVAAKDVRAAVQRFKDAPRKALLFGRAIAEHPEAAKLLAAIESLGWALGAITPERSFVMYLGPQHNSQGALDMGLVPDRLPGYVDPADAEARKPFEQQWGATLDLPSGLSAPEILAAAAEGRIKALWIASDEWLASAPDRALAERALERCEIVIVNELFLTDTAKRAHVVFPASAFAEKEGVAVNCERRLQRVARAFSPRRGTRADWEIIQAVGRSLGAKWSYRSAEDIFREIARLVPGIQGTSIAQLIPDGHLWSTATPVTAALDGAPWAAPMAPAHADGLALLSGGTLFLQGTLSHRSETLTRLAKESRAWLHPDEAQRLGIGAGERIEIATPAGSISIMAALDDAVPPGSVFVPYAQRGVHLNRLGAPGAAGLRVQVRRSALPVGA
ncbi:MAG TPA: NADH-quinone oxidoreductase subunit NuoG [Candidatus Udaeobacter sp.]|nr:NADH-quinone oxidoreductase subunit NuoG [Candidatus Udaeobacter sp.]